MDEPLFEQEQPTEKQSRIVQGILAFTAFFTLISCGILAVEGVSGRGFEWSVKINLSLSPCPTFSFFTVRYFFVYTV